MEFHKFLQNIKCREGLMDKGVPRLLSPDYWAGWTQASGVRPPGRPQPHGRHATGQHTGAYAKDLCMTTNPPALPSVGCSATKQRKNIFSKDIKRTLWEEVKELERCWWSGETPLRGPVQSSRLLPARLPRLKQSEPRWQLRLCRQYPEVIFEFPYFQI